MKIEEFMKKHARSISAYMRALDKFGKKRHAMIDDVKIMQNRFDCAYPSLRSRSTPGFRDRTDDLIQEYDKTIKKFENPVLFDPEYRSAYKALLIDLRDDTDRMLDEAGQAVQEAYTEYEETSDKLYKKYMDAQKEWQRINREVGDIVVKAHKKMISDSLGELRNSRYINSEGDALKIMVEDTVSGYIRYLLSQIDKIDKKASDESIQ